MCDVIVSNFAIPFCSKFYFEKFWNVLCNSLNSNGYFLGNFFGIEDEWNDKKKLMSFFSIKQVEELFNDFDIIELNEKIYDEKTGMGILKHWDVIDVLAKKK